MLSRAGGKDIDFAIYPPKNVIWYKSLATQDLQIGHP